MANRPKKRRAPARFGKHFDFIEAQKSNSPINLRCPGLFLRELQWVQFHLCEREKPGTTRLNGSLADVMECRIARSKPGGDDVL
jgi:hypothetical protein